MKAVICGAGIAGLALARRLIQRDWSVIIAEQSPGPRRQGYLIDFFGPGYRAAEKMDVLPRLKERGYDVPAASFVDEHGRRRGRLDYARFQRTVGGHALTIMRPDIEQAFRDSIDGDADLRFDCTVTEWQETAGGVRVSLSDGTEHDADVLVGADGIHSTIRARTFGDERQFLRYLGMHTAAYTFTDPHIHRQLDDGIALTDSFGAMMGLYALGGDTVAAFTAHRRADPALPADVGAELRTAFDGLGWHVPGVLAKCPDNSEIYYDQVAQIVMPRWSRGRVVLVGDACQAVSLVAGQGASLAVAGAFQLAESLTAASDVPAGVAAYQQRWQPVVAEKQRAGRRGAGWFLPASRPRLKLRRVVLGASQAPGVRRLISVALSGRTRPDSVD